MAGKAGSFARSLGRRLVALREERGLTQERLAWEAGLSSKGYLSRIERGQRLPSLAVLQHLASRLAVEPRDLLTFPERGPVEQAADAVGRLGEAFARRVLESTTEQDRRARVLAAAEPSTAYARRALRTRPRRKR